MSMKIEESMAMGLCTSLKTFRKTEYQHLEPVDWDIYQKQPVSLASPKEAVCAENDNKYFKVPSLWYLKHILDERKIKQYDAGQAWSKSYYLPELSNNCNMEGYEYDVVGYKFDVKTEIFYVEDIERFIKVVSGIIV